MPPTMGGPPDINMQQYTSPTVSLQKKFYTVQRVNGNGGNGKGDGVAGPHKHTLEESDRVKKNSVIRWQMKVDKDDKRKSQVSFAFLFSLAVLSTCLASIDCNNHAPCQ